MRLRLSNVPWFTGMVVVASIAIASCGQAAGSGLVAGGRPGSDAANGREIAASPPAPSPASNLARTRGKTVWLESLQMTSATAGWALIWTANPFGTAYLEPARTSDGGRMWSSVVPEALQSTPAGQALLQAKSAERAWIAVVGANGRTSKQTIVYSTNDGGSTWARSAPVPGADPVAIDFVDARHGWLLESMGAAMGRNPVQLYRTTDSGLRWSRVAESRTANTPASPSGLPVLGDKNGLAFASASVGWMTGECNCLEVLISRDGGAHWASQPVPVPARICESGGCEVPAPQFAGRTTFLQINAYPRTGYLLVSRDGGASWKAESLPAGAGPYPRLTFFGARHGIAVSAGAQGMVGSTFYVTSDGGLSWTAVHQGKVFSRAPFGFDFVSPSAGFAWIPGADSAGGAPDLEVTTNSGRTWTAFHPLEVS